MRGQIVYSHSNKEKMTESRCHHCSHFHPWRDKKWVRTFPTLRTWFQGQLLQTQSSSADHSLLPLSSLSLSPSETPAGRFWDYLKSWMILPLAEGWNNVENIWHQIKGNKEQVKLLGIFYSHSSVVISPLGRTPLLGMEEPGEVPSNLAADSGDSEPKRMKKCPPIERPCPVQQKYPSPQGPFPSKQPSLTLRQGEIRLVWQDLCCQKASFIFTLEPVIS